MNIFEEFQAHEKPLTRDLVEFVPGMTLYYIGLGDGYIKTTEEMKAVKTKYGWCLDQGDGAERKRLMLLFYAHNENKIKNNRPTALKHIQSIKQLAEKEIEFINGGGNPEDCFLCSKALLAIFQ